MRTLLVLVSENETGAPEIVGSVQAMQRQQRITVSDAAVVIRQNDGAIKVRQANNLVGVGALGGAFWGLMIGQYFWSPWLNLTSVEVTDTVAGIETSCGIDEAFLKKVGDAIKPGYSALFLIVVYLTAQSLAELARNDSVLMYTELSQDSDAKLCAAFGIMDAV